MDSRLIASITQFVELDNITVAAFIICALQNPESPTKCSPSMTFALLRLVGAVQFGDSIDEKKIKLSGLVKALFLFLSTERSPPQIKKMFKGRPRCDDCSEINPGSRSHASAILHDMCKTSIHMVPGDDNTDMERFICLAFEVTSRLLSTIQFKTFAQDLSKTWPFKLSDLVPSGPDNHAQLLFEIFKVCPDSGLSKTIAATISLCRTRVYDSFLKHPFVERSSQNFKYEIDQAIKQVDSGVPNFANMAIDRLWITGCSFFEFLQCAMEPHVPTPVTISLLNGCECHFLQICSISLYLLSHLKTCLSSDKRYMVLDLQRGAIRAGSALLQGFHMPMSGRGTFFHFSARQTDVAHHPLIVNGDNACNFGATEGFEAEIVLASILRNMSDNFCANYDCHQCLETAGAKFKKCRDCQVVFYCSVKCQAVDWKMEELSLSSHKRLCPVLRKLHITVHGPSESESASSIPDSDANQKTSLLRKFQNPTARLQEKIKAVHAAVVQAQLTPEEVKLLYDWVITVGVNIWSPLYNGMQTSTRVPGFDEYKTVIERFTDPKGPFKGPKAKYPKRIRNLPMSEDIKQEKKSLQEHSLVKQAGGNSREIKMSVTID